MLWLFKINFVDFVGFLSMVIQVMLFYIHNSIQTKTGTSYAMIYAYSIIIYGNEQK